MKNTFLTPVIPANDNDRLEALARYDLLDSPAEAAFDNLVHIIAEVFHTPIAFISFVDRERVFFKANVGMPGVVNESRGVCLCALTVLNEQPTVFEDALQEPCLLANPLVTGSFGLRFYAGAPLITEDGHAIGTVCIVDKKCRTFGLQERLLLQRFAATVMYEIELRQAANLKMVYLNAQVKKRSVLLHKANVELARSKRELKRFAYLTSHDLQEPLRKIVTFSGLLYTQIESFVDEKSLFYWQRIRYNAEQMQQKLRDILIYFQIETDASDRVCVDLNEVWREICQDLEIVISQKAANIVVDRLPCIEANASQMRQLFSHIVDNALKFAKPDREPIITVTSRVISVEEKEKLPLQANREYIQIVVSDNGIGFAPEFAEQIFVIFQRLHPYSEFGGNGIGLALCQRIVENHTGILFAEGRPGEGADFKIILPFL